MTGHNDVESESEREEENDDMPPLEDCSDVEMPVNGELMVVRRSLSVQVKEEEHHQQRDNLFHTRCLVNGKICSLIVDGGSCTNVASCTMVEKLRLKTTNHPRPYRLQLMEQISVVMTRYKTPPHHCFHRIPRFYWSLTIASPASYKLIPPNYSIISEFNSCNFYLFELRI